MHLRRNHQWLLAYYYSQPPGTSGLSNIGPSLYLDLGDHNSMSIFVDSSSDETLHQGPLALLFRQQYKFLFGINIVQFSIFNLFFSKFSPERPNSTNPNEPICGNQLSEKVDN